MERTRSRRVAVVVVVMYGMVERLVVGGIVKRNSGWGLEECFAGSGAVEVSGDKGEEGGRVGGFVMD